MGKAIDYSSEKLYQYGLLAIPTFPAYVQIFDLLFASFDCYVSSEGFGSHCVYFFGFVLE